MLFFWPFWVFLSFGLEASGPSFVGLSICLSKFSTNVYNILQWITQTQSFMPLDYLLAYFSFSGKFANPDPPPSGKFHFFKNLPLIKSAQGLLSLLNDF